MVEEAGRPLTFILSATKMLSIRKDAVRICCLNLKREGVIRKERTKRKIEKREDRDKIFRRNASEGLLIALICIAPGRPSAHRPPDASPCRLPTCYTRDPVRRYPRVARCQGGRTYPLIDLGTLEHGQQSTLGIGPSLSVLHPRFQVAQRADRNYCPCVHERC